MKFEWQHWEHPKNAIGLALEWIVYYSNLHKIDDKDAETLIDQISRYVHSDGKGLSWRRIKNLRPDMSFTMDDRSYLKSPKRRVLAGLEDLLSAIAIIDQVNAVYVFVDQACLITEVDLDILDKLQVKWRVRDLVSRRVLVKKILEDEDLSNALFTAIRAKAFHVLKDMIEESKRPELPLTV